MKTTLAQIRSYGPCQDRWNYGLQHADPRPADDEPFPVSRVLETNGLSDTLWLLGEMGEKQLLVRLASDCAERAVERYWAPEYPSDRRPQRAIAAARRWLAEPTAENLSKADAAAEAAYAAAYHVTRAACYAARAAVAAAADLADPAARAAVAAAEGAYAVAAVAAAEAAAYAAKEREWQIDRLRTMLEDV